MANNKLTDAPGQRQKFYFQFITTPTADTPGTTLLLHFDNKRYFFGRIPEGTQRACIQRGIGIKKVRNLFLTGPTTWNSMGGMLGMILTMADVQFEEIDPVTGKRPQLRICGGPKLMHSVACARRFIFRTGMPLAIQEARLHGNNVLEPSYTDDNISVWSIPVRRYGRSGASSPRLLNGRSQSPNTVNREQSLRAETVKNMFDSDWRKDRLVESRFSEVKLPALIWFRTPDTKELTYTQCTTMADAPHLQPDSKVLVRNPWPASLVEELPPVDNIAGSVAISYVVRGKPQRGKFLPQKAKELGVPSGPKYALLAAGGSVTLENGSVVTSDMVLSETESGKGMAIFDIPSDEYLGDLSEKLEASVKPILEGIETVSWLLGKGVVHNPAFVQLIESLPSLQHIVSSPDTSPNYLALDAASASSIRLAQVRPECFRVPVHENKNPLASSSLQNLPYILAERGLIVQVAPKSLLNRAEIPPFLDVTETKSAYTEILKGLMPTQTETNQSNGKYDNVEILTLGTGSAVPSKYRNVSGTLVRIPNVGTVLFDCGENTIGTLRRAYTAPELDEVLADLRMIWISHLHADHHLGTLSVIAARAQAMQHLGRTEPKLYIISEPNMADYLNDYNSVQSTSHCELLGVINSKFVTKNSGSPQSTIEISQTSLPITEFLTTRVSHCHGAQACSITFSNGFKFSYSGDCRPSAQFAKIGQNSDVLLHEATFDDGLEGDAMAKKHSTTGEALAVAHAMKAKNVILTHFSQRYQKIPVLSNVKFGDVRFEEGDDAEESGPIETDMAAPTSEQIVTETSQSETAVTTTTSNPSESMATLQKVARDMNICVAFDLMSVTVGQIPDMYKYYPAIEKMFELEHEKSEAVKDGRREANERTKLAKETKENKWKNSIGKKDNPTDSEGGDFYERINRSKTKGNKEANGSVIPSDMNADAGNNTTGGSSTANTNPQIPMSNRARQRQLKKLQAAQNQLGTQHGPGLVPGSSNTELTNDAHKSTRQLSVEPEVSESKRQKLDDETTG